MLLLSSIVNADVQQQRQLKYYTVFADEGKTRDI